MNRPLSMAVMQPYVFPYLGYFRLINAVDKFVFFDDVNYIKRGWINRNRILLANKPFLFTVPVSRPSQNRRINETLINGDLRGILRTIHHAYAKAPYYNCVYPVLKHIFEQDWEGVPISMLAEKSIISICHYLGIQRVFERTSKDYKWSIDLKGQDRILEILHVNQATKYINAEGGKELYNPSEFRKRRIQLFFLKNSNIVYKQYNDRFVSNLSIIDVLMFNDKQQVNNFIMNNYELLEKNE